MTTNPGPDGEAPVVLRTGRKLGRTIYLQTGPEPADTDPVIGMLDTREYAAGVVAAVNAAWLLTEWFTHQAALGDEDAARWLELGRPIWAAGWVPGGGRTADGRG